MALGWQYDNVYEELEPPGHARESTKFGEDMPREFELVSIRQPFRNSEFSFTQSTHGCRHEDHGSRGQLHLQTLTYQIYNNDLQDLGVPKEQRRESRPIRDVEHPALRTTPTALFKQRVQDVVSTAQVQHVRVIGPLIPAAVCIDPKLRRPLQ